jgi:hypothetical protein
MIIEVTLMLGQEGLLYWMVLLFTAKLLCPFCLLNTVTVRKREGERNKGRARVEEREVQRGWFVKRQKKSDKF